MRNYQRDIWGRAGSPTCVIELLPLPSPNAHSWPYSEYSKLPQLSNRGAYVMSYAHSRAEHLRRRISEHKPRAVIFYGAGYMHWWESIALAPFARTTIGGAKCQVARSSTTLYLAISHPTSMGTSNAYLEAVGKYIATEQGNS